MSEQKSLYVRIKIKKENLERFFQEKPVAAAIDQEWTAWWDSRNMYGRSALTEIPFYDRMETNRAVLDAYLNDRQSWTVEQVNEDRGEWVLCIVFFSENYIEIMPMLAWLKSMANYQDAGDEGVAMVYDFFWGGMLVMAHLEFDQQQASLKLTTQTAEIEPEVLADANKTLQQAMAVIDDRFSKKIDPAL